MANDLPPWLDVNAPAEGSKLIAALKEANGEIVILIYVDQGYTGERNADAAKSQGRELCVVKLAEATKGFVLLLKRWVVERSFASVTLGR
jgi:transposase